jgi:glycosyltransferase involved in cell wall biosynthesis
MKKGGVGEFVRDGTTGFLVADDHEMSFRAAQLVTNRALLYRMSRNACTNPPDLDWATIVRLSLDTYAWAGARITQREPVA